MAVPLYGLIENNLPRMAEFQAAFAEVAGSGQFILGPAVADFERQLADYVGVKHCIGVGSGTDALIVSLMALGVGPGDEVITSPLSYVHTAGSIMRLGATPVFCDINPRTYNLAIQSLEGCITERTKAIVPVHLYGQMCKMKAIMELAEPRGIKVLEDGDQAIGAKCDGKMAGSIGDAGIFSFFPTKNLAAMGDAGAVVTNDDALAKQVRKLRVHGIEPGYTVHTLGGNFRIDAFQARVLSLKLPDLDAQNERRREIADRYARHLDDLQVSTPIGADDREHTYNHYTIRVRSGGRDALAGHLDACDIGNRVYYPRPLHLLPCFESLGYKEGAMPVAELATREVLSLPIYPEMTRDQQDEVVEAIRDYFRAE
ncbi:MAG: DegT/DnrJ/EryC1/StrS family aminotransferase [Phycisphaerales bacterium JB063]